MFVSTRISFRAMRSPGRTGRTEQSRAYLMGTADDKGVEEIDGEERRRGLAERQIGFRDARIKRQLSASN